MSLLRHTRAASKAYIAARHHSPTVTHLVLVVFHCAILKAKGQPMKGLPQDRRPYCLRLPVRFGRGSAYLTIGTARSLEVRQRTSTQSAGVGTLYV